MCARKQQCKYFTEMRYSRESCHKTLKIYVIYSVTCVVMHAGIPWLSWLMFCLLPETMTTDTCGVVRRCVRTVRRAHTKFSVPSCCHAAARYLYVDLPRTEQTARGRNKGGRNPGEQISAHRIACSGATRSFSYSQVSTGAAPNIRFACAEWTTGIRSNN